MKNNTKNMTPKSSNISITEKRLSIEERTRAHKKIGKITLGVILYFFIFQPPLFDKIIYPAAWLVFFIIISIYKHKFISKYITTFRAEILFGLTIVFWAIFRDLFSGEIVYSDRFTVWFLQCLIFPSIIIMMTERSFEKKISAPHNIIQSVYTVVIAAGTITIALYAFPTLDNFYKSIQVDGYYDFYKGLDVRHRAYGAAENLTFTYGYVLGVFAGYSLIKSLDSKIHLIPFFILLFGVFINARIGFIPIIATAAWIAIFRPVTKYLIHTFLAVAILLIFDIESTRIGVHLSWGLDFFRELTLFFSGESNNTIGVLLNDMVVIPSDLVSFMFGSGKSLYEIDSGNSDVGYILQLNYAGILFLLALVSTLALCSLRLYRSLGATSWIAMIFTISVFALNMKGFLFAATPGARLFFFLYAYHVYHAHRVNS